MPVSFATSWQLGFRIHSGYTDPRRTSTALSGTRRGIAGQTSIHPVASRSVRGHALTGPRPSALATRRRRSSSSTSATAHARVTRRARRAASSLVASPPRPSSSSAIWTAASWISSSVIVPPRWVKRPPAVRPYARARAPHVPVAAAARRSDRRWHEARFRIRNVQESRHAEAVTGSVTRSGAPLRRRTSRAWRRNCATRDA